MDLFGRKMRFVLLVSGAAIVMLILAWRFVQGGAASLQEGFVPVNGQMQELLNRQLEEADAKVDKDSKSGTEAGEDMKNTMNVQGAIDSNDGEVNGSAAPSLEHPATEVINKLNINTATWEQLDKLPGIGESKGKAIIAYRGEKGYFHKIEDLVQVKGIGDKMLDKLKPYIYAELPR